MKLNEKAASASTLCLDRCYLFYIHCSLKLKTLKICCLFAYLKAKFTPAAYNPASLSRNNFHSLSHVVTMFPPCLPGPRQVEVLIAISSVTSPLLFSASGFLSSSVISFIEIFLHDVPTSKVSPVSGGI